MNENKINRELLFILYSVRVINEQKTVYIYIFFLIINVFKDYRNFRRYFLRFILTEWNLKEKKISRLSNKIV